ncbi:MAG: MarR family transcriptional regulator [Pseudomonadota bacterium]
MPDDRTALFFELFNEIGILNQLAVTLFEAHLPDGMLISHFSVLNHLVRVSDGQTPLVLARAFQVPKTTMTHTLSGLEKAGLVETRPNPKDGRSKCVWLTEAGRRFRSDAIAALGPDVADLSAQFPADRVTAALPHLTALRKILDARRD